MHVLLLPFGSHGDVHPLIGLGSGLKKRGHRVTLLSLPNFRDLADRHGFDFVAIGSQADYEAQVQHPDLWHPTRSLNALFSGDIFPRLLRETYFRLVDLHVPGDTVIVAGSLALAARVAQDRFGVPVATVHLQPSSYPSVTDPPVFANLRFRHWWPHWYRRLLYWIGNRFVMGPTVGRAVNHLRREVGLPPEPLVFGRWRHSPSLILGFFPDWYATARDWPEHFDRVGFIRYDQGEAGELSWDVRGFLDDGPPPAVFTFGSAMRQGRKYFETAAAVCKQLGIRGLLLARGKEQIPDPLPSGVFHAEYVPFSQVFRRASVVVHHGGIGTVSQALAAGVPQLVMPLAFDQPDNAAHLERLGVGRTLFPNQFTPDRLAPLLRQLTQSSEIAAACAEYAARDDSPAAVVRACERIEKLKGTDRITKSN